MNKFVLIEKENWKYTLEEYIEMIKKQKYIDCDDYDYEYWYILEKLEELNKLIKEMN